MRQKASSRFSLGLVSAGAKDNIRAYRKGQGIHRLGGLCRILVRVKPYLAEVLSEPRLKERLRAGLQGLARCI
jgi:hypothetical protein